MSSAAVITLFALFLGACSHWKPCRHGPLAKRPPAEVRRMPKVVACPGKEPRHHSTGSVDMHLLVLENGTVGDIELIAGPTNWLIRSAMSDASRCTFVPAQGDAGPVATWIVYRFTFVDGEYVASEVQEAF